MHPFSTRFPPASRRPQRCRRCGLPLAALAPLLGLLVTTLGTPAAHAVEETATRSEALRWDGSGERVLKVCNIQGSVIARGVSADAGSLVDRETYRGPSAASVARAKEAMPLQITRHGNLIEVSVGGPCEGERDGDHRRNRDDRWEAIHELRIDVPQGVRTELRTINQGEVRLTGHRGPFELTNVNGDVSAEEISGSGRASTVNGTLRIRFAETPREACSFSAVNGPIDLAFPADLRASFQFQTLNGEIYTDFPFDMAPLRERVERVDRNERDRSKGRYRIHKRWSTSVAIGGSGGGPEHSIRNVNGDITIRRR